MTNKTLSFGAAMGLVVTALITGIVASLAIRPPGKAAAASDETAQAGERDRISWKVPVSFNTNVVILGEMIVQIGERLRLVSDGAVDLQIFEPGELVPVLSITDAVRDQKVEAGLTWLGYDQGKIPASALISAVPFGMEPWEFMGWWYEGGGRELGEALYHEHRVHPILCGVIGPETAGWFRQPVKSIDDFRGLKIRFAGLGGKVLQRVGASVTMLPGGEIFPALEKGAIDATEFSLPAVDQMLGFDRVASFNYFPGWHQPSTAFHMVVNLDLWRGLRDDTRALIATTCESISTYALARSEALQGEVIEQFDERGVTAGVLPRELLEALRDKTNEVLDEEAAADPRFARILASQRAFSRTYGSWKRVGYLPRDF